MDSSDSSGDEAMDVENDIAPNGMSCGISKLLEKSRMRTACQGSNRQPISELSNKWKPKILVRAGIFDVLQDDPTICDHHVEILGVGFSKIYGKTKKKCLWKNHSNAKPKKGEKRKNSRKERMVLRAINQSDSQILLEKCQFLLPTGGSFCEVCSPEIYRLLKAAKEPNPGGDTGNLIFQKKLSFIFSCWRILHFFFNFI